MKYFILASLFMLTSCLSQHSKPENKIISGLWIPISIPENISEECKLASVEYQKNGVFKITSGEQIIKGNYTLEKLDGGYLLKDSDISSNGKPNCQRISSDYVLSHYIYNIYIEFQSGSMKMYSLKNRNVIFAEMKRK